MNKPRLLDLFCGAGGAARGYQQAGFYVVGVDIHPQPRYCGDEFIQADALTFSLDGFDIIHASPPCQRYTHMLNHGIGDRNNHPDLVGVVRERLRVMGKAFVIENVIGAPIERMILLCGAMFGLRVYRHRQFESNILLFQPEHPRHLAKASKASRIPREDEFWCPVGKFGKQAEAGRAMGIDWMQTGVHDPYEIAQSIPPAYTEWIGHQMREVI